MRARVGVGLALLLLLVLVAYQSLPRSTADTLPTRTRAAELATLAAVAPDSGRPESTPGPPPGTPASGAPAGIILFQSSRDTPGALQLFAMRADGGAVRRLGGITPGAGFPRLSPDGTRVAFVGNTGAADDIYTVNLDGSDLVRVTADLGNNRFPTWSPDGQRLAFGSDRSGDWEVYTTDIRGGDLARVTLDPADDNLPSWSPDGRWIAFQSDRDGAMHLYKAHPDGTDAAALTRGNANDRYPTWSPDGRRIAFYSDRAGGIDQLYVIDADGARETRLLVSRGRDQLPNWSPDGRWLAFASERDGRWGIYQLALDQGIDRLLTQIPDSYAPSWGAATPAAASLFAGTAPPVPTFGPATATLAPTSPVSTAAAPRPAAPTVTATIAGPSPTVPLTPTATALTAPAGLGQTIRLRNWELTVRGVGRPGGTLKWSDDGDTSKAAGTWVVVTVDLRNIGGRDFGVSPWDFSLLAEDGTEYGLSPDAGAAAYSIYQGGSFVGEAMPPGAVARYYLVFDIDPNAAGLRFVFEQDTRPVFDLGR